MKKSFFHRMLLAFSLFAPAFMHQALAQPTPVQPSGSGTSGDPYLVATLANYYWISQNDTVWDAYYLQTDNIDASSSSQWYFDSTHFWYGITPIGTNSVPFTGTYDGDYHYISGLNFKNNSRDTVGLFGYVSSGMIKNLGIVDVEFFTENECVGAIAGAGGLLINCYSTGGVYGYLFVGGLVGLSGTVSRCFSSCGVSASGRVGGLGGYGTNVNNSYYNGGISGGGDPYAGGLVGVSGSNAEYCYSLSSPYPSGDPIFGDGSATILECYYNSELGYSYYPGTTGLTTSEMKTLSTYIDEGWDFVGETTNGTDDIWNINSHINNGYPFLAWQLTAGFWVSVINITDTVAYINGSNIGFTAESGTVTLSYVKYDDTPPDLPGGAVTIGTYWNVSSTSGGNVKLRLYYPATSTASFTGAPTILHYSSGQWEALPTSSEGTDGSLKYVETTGYYSSFSPVTVGDGSAALPVELTHFTASAERNNIELKWLTATEVNNYGFEIQRSEVGSQKSEVSGHSERSEESRRWMKVGFVEGSGTTNSPKSYSFVDASAKGKVAYRLKQIDNDGSFKYSQEVEVTAGTVPKVFSLEQNYPNPFNPTTTIGFTLQASGLTTLKVYDVIGREVATLVNGNLKAGEYHQATFNASNLASGIYFARLQNGKQVQLKKLMLLK